MSHENLMALFKSPTGKPNKWRTLTEYIFSSVDKVPVWAWNGTGSVGKLDKKLNYNEEKKNEVLVGLIVRKLFGIFLHSYFLLLFLNLFNSRETPSEWTICTIIWQWFHEHSVKRWTLILRQQNQTNRKNVNENLLKPHIKVTQTQKCSHTEKCLRSLPPFHFTVLIFNFYHNMLLVDLGEQLVMSG